MLLQRRDKKGGLTTEETSRALLNSSSDDVIQRESLPPLHFGGYFTAATTVGTLLRTPTPLNTGINPVSRTTNQQTSEHDLNRTQRLNMFAPSARGKTATVIKPASNNF
jgi:hypothetical protein